MTPSKVRRLAAASPAAVPEGERVAVFIPDNGRGPTPGRYRASSGAVVIVPEPAPGGACEPVS